MGDRYAWLGLLPLSSMLRFNDDVNHYLMGNPRDSLKSNSEPNPANRGLPINPGDELRGELYWMSEFQMKHKHNSGVFGYTNFRYDEILLSKTAKRILLPSKESDWVTVFAMIDVFIARRNIEAEQIRFTCWYVW
ncbi:hypothetical protein GGR28_003794 [Lewinella aquimaris]|uniref:Uncharacterized protein n=1 Tax=Neolewinella aquimaris TaxID=1835722 RepID=A0A840EJT9_9BACT|nr:hypothetical protein [Neolewinella aquimaris]